MPISSTPTSMIPIPTTPTISGPTLCDHFEDAARGTGTIRFPAANGETQAFADIWRDSAHAASWLTANTDGAAVAIVLTAGPRCLPVLLGIWRAGLTAASIPHPSRGMPVEEYRDQVLRMCRVVGATMLVVPDEYVALLPDLPVAVRGYSDCFGPVRLTDANGAGDLVQFSSGSTGRPKGVRLSSAKVASHIAAILTVIVMEPGDTVCSWLPLSHDMGLIGLCLSGLVAMGTERTGDLELTLLPPESFLRRPMSWLETCSERRVAVTGVPNFAFDVAARALRSPALRGGTPLDLSNMRVCLSGGESIRSTSLRAFTEAAAPFGFDDHAFCPAYGMAEATLAVTMVRPAQRWTSRQVDADLLTSGQWAEVVPGAGVDLVSTGPLIPGTEVRITGGAAVGQIEVRSPTLLDTYVGADHTLLDGGWLETKDLGAMVDGELYVCGRLDDVIVIRGRNLHPWDLEGVVAGHAGVRKGNCVAVSNGEGGYAVVAEPALTADGVDLGETSGWIRRNLAARFGVGPSQVTFVEPGSLPKTPSGKVQRRKVAAALGAGGLKVSAEHRFGAGAPRAANPPAGD